MAQLVRFLLVGAANTVVGLSFIFISMWLFRIDYRLANALGYAIGFGVSFLLNRTWTFRYRGRWSGSFARWLVVGAFGYGLNFLTVVFLHQSFGIGSYFVQVAGVFVYTIVAFLGARFFAFRDRRPQLTMEPI